MSEQNKNTVIQIQLSDLPISCPTHETILWNAHPRVYLPLDETHREAICPYCDTKFVLTE